MAATAQITCPTTIDAVHPIVAANWWREINYCTIRTLSTSQITSIHLLSISNSTSAIL